MKIGNHTVTTGTLIAIIGVAVLLGTVAYGIYTVTSNHVTGAPSGLPSFILTANSSTPISGDTLQLTCQLGSSAIGLSGWTVDLRNNGALVGTQTADATGKAVFNITITASFDFVATGTHN